MALGPLASFKAARSLVGRLLRRDPVEEDEQEQTDVFLPGPPASQLDQEQVAERVADELRRDATDVKELPPGKQFVVDFTIAAEHYGTRWPSLIGRAKILSERVLKRRLGEFVAYREEGDESLAFVILDEDIVEEDIEPLGNDIAFEIIRLLIGGEDQEEFKPRRKSDPDPTEAVVEAPKVKEEEPAPAIRRTAADPEAEAAVQPGLGFVDAAEPDDFSGGWEFAEGPETVRKAEYESSYEEVDQETPTSEAKPDANLDIPTAESRAEAQIETPTSEGKPEDQPLFSLTDQRDETEPVAEYSSSDQEEIQPDFTSEDRPDENQITLDFGPDRVEEAPPAPAPTFSLAETLMAIAASAERPPEPQYVPQSDALPEAELAIPISEDRPEESFDTGTSADRPEEPIGIPTSETREEAEIGIATSEDRPSEEIADMAPTEEIVAATGDFGTSEDRAEAEAVLVTSSDRDEAELAVPTSETIAEDELAIPTSETIAEATYDIGQTDTIERPEIDIPTSEDRAEEASEHEVAISETRDEAAPVLVESGDRAPDEEIAVPLSGDRPQDELSIPTSEDRATQEFAVPTSDDRPDEEQAVPTSEERAGDEDGHNYAVPLSEDRIQALLGVPTSGDKPEGEVDVPTSQDHADAPPVIVESMGDGEEPERREFEVEQTETKEERSFDYGQSEERKIAEPTYQFEPGTERVAAEPVTAPIAAPVAAYNIRLRYGAWLDTHADTVTTYVADPCNRGPDGSETEYHRLLAAGPPPESCFDLDCMMLRLAIREVTKIRAEGGRMLLGLPVAASTLLRPKYRARYMQMWREVDEETRKTTRLTAYHLPQTSASQASDLFGWLRSIARAPIVRIPPRTELLAPLAGLGVYGISINYSKWHHEMGEQAFVERIARMVKLAKAANLRLALINLPDRRAVQIGLATGCDYLEIAVMEHEANIPRRLTKIDRAKLVGKQS